MADDSELNIRIKADLSGLASAQSGLRDVVAEQERFESAAKLASSAAKQFASQSAEMGEALDQGRALTSGMTREIVVLGHEVMSGNFSRIPGSLVVLGERMGGLQLATVGMVAAVAAVGYALYEFAANAERAAEFTGNLETQMQFAGRSYAFSAAQAKALVDTLHDLPGVSELDARGMVSLGETSRLTASQLAFVAQNAQKFAQATGQDIPAAFRQLVGVLDEPLSKFNSLNDRYVLLNDAQEKLYLGFQKTGDVIGAQDLVLTALGARFDTVETHITPLQERLNEFRKGWDSLADSISRVGAELLEDPFGDHAVDATDPANRKKGLPVAGDADKKASATPSISAAENDSQLSDQDIAGADFVRRQQMNRNSEANHSRNRPDHSTQDASAEIAEQRRVEEEKFQVRAEYIRLRATEASQSSEQEYAALIQNAQKEQAAEQESYQRQSALWREGTKEYAKVQNEMQLAKQRSQLTIDRLVREGVTAEQTEVKKAAAERDQAAQKSARTFETGIRGMQSQFNSSIAGMLTGTETLGQSFRSMATSLATGMIEAMLSVGEQWAATQLLMLVLGKPTSEAIISGHAGEAFAAAYAATAAIPIIGPALAPESASAAAAAALAGGSSLNSAAGGWDRVPNDQLAQIHKNEMILPAPLASKVRNMSDGGGSGGDTHVHFNVSAMDAKGVKSFLDQHGPSIAHVVAGQVRNGNRKMGKALAGR